MFAIAFAKMVINLSKLMGYNGTNIGGELALRIYPDILKSFEGQIKDKIIFITGTNGKTSTNNMVISIIEEKECPYVANKLGANLDSGVTSAFILKSNLLGNIKAKYACLEVDEASIPKILPQLKPNIMLFTNLFKDQLDRYIETDMLAKKIQNSLRGSEDIILLVNADDPSLVNMAQDLPNSKYYYGIQTRITMEMDGYPKDSIFCKDCGARLIYTHLYYGQLGHYFCPKCGFSRPKPNIWADIQENHDNRKLKIYSQNKDFTVEIEVGKEETYSLYNYLAAIACAMLLDMDKAAITRGLLSYKPQVGRMEQFYIKDKSVTINLAKNPVGFNETMKIVIQEPSKKVVALGINDLPQDGQDVSWLWDTNFEILTTVDNTIEEYIVFGRRRHDMALRLKYAGIAENKIKISDSIDEAVETVKKANCSMGFMLLNYSLLFETRKALARQTTTKEK